MEEVRKINDKTDNGPKNGLGLEEIKGLKKQREQRFSQLEDYEGDFGTQIGKKEDGKDVGMEKEAEEKEKEVFTKKEEARVEGNEDVSPEVMEEIKKIISDPTSELSLLNKAVNFEEDYIVKLKGNLEKIKESKVDREIRVKTAENSLRDHKDILERKKKRIVEIISEIEKKISK